MGQNAKQPLKKDHVQRQDFSYQMGDVSLNFKLRIDIKDELKAFKAILAEAIKDVDSFLGK